MVLQCNGARREDISILNNCCNCEHSQPHYNDCKCVDKVIMCGIFIGVKCIPCEIYKNNS